MSAIMEGAAVDTATLCIIADEAVAAFNSNGRHVQSFLDDAYRVTTLASAPSREV